MSTSSELSRILSNVNGAVYPTEAQPLNSTPYTIMTKSLQTADLTFGSTFGPWEQVNPLFWTQRNVLDWIDFHVEDSKFDASLLNMGYCVMDGPVLCQLPRESFSTMFGLLGEQLYHSLEALKSKHGVTCDLPDPYVLNETCALLNDFLGDLPQYSTFLSDASLLETVVVQDVDIKRENDPYNYFNDFKNRDLTSLSDGYESGSNLSDSLHGSTSGSFLNPSSPESAGSDSELEPSDVRGSINAKSFIKQERGEQKKRGRGRPPKQNRGSDHYLETKKNKHAPRGTHLWEFIRDILLHPEQNQGLMKWEDRRDGIFKFLKSEAVAQLWGQKKKNSSMTYEKLSRAMRYYYKRDILERVDGRRLVYKFGKNSSGWKLEEVGLGR
ncbi:ETS-related transcription factor Elf-3 [Denticeps clupeoides]|uniref:ETS domain-containing protein n=1 Tax=Denticeps clupeoides TaxID=299321 RepID=A0AAY4C800_9TELE|nr:ETS-related transcription factor Elf-3 [Denticeps clupeoides]